MRYLCSRQRCGHNPTCSNVRQNQQTTRCFDRIREILADKGYDSAANRTVCRRYGLIPSIICRRGRGTTRQSNGQTARSRRRVSSNESHPQAPPAAENSGNTPRDEDRRRPVERCFAWQDNYRRTTLRYECLEKTFRAMHFISLSAILCKRLQTLGVED